MRAFGIIVGLALAIPGLAATRTDEAALIALLKPGSPAVTQAEACRKLARAGTRASVPSLARLLNDPAVAHMARFALEAMPGPEASKALRAALRSLKGPLLVGAINSIGVRRDVEASGALAAFLQNPDVETARAAAGALGRIGSPAAADSLEKAGRKAPTSLVPALQEARLECAGALAAGRNSERAIAIFDSLGSSSTPVNIRTAAIRGAIVARGASGSAILVRMLRAGDTLQVKTALWVVSRELPGSGVTQALADALSTVPADRAPMLIGALAARGDRAALPALRAAASSGGSAIRIAALNALPELGGADSVPVLIRALASADSDVTAAAREALSRLPSGTLAIAATELGGSPDSAQRLSGIELIRKRRLPGFGRRLIEMTSDTHAPVRLAALKALSELAGPDEVPALLDALAAAKDDSEARAAEEALAGACDKAPDREASAERIADRLQPAHPSNNAALLRVLGGIGGARALAAVRAAAGGPAGEARDAAIRALCDWSTADAAPDLLQLARSAEAAALKLPALRGFIRLSGDDGLAPERRISMCADARPLITRDEERRQWLGALGGIPSATALEFITPLIGDPAVSEEACSAAAAVCGKLLARPASVRPQLAIISGALKKALESAKSAPLQNEVKRLLAKTTP